MSGCLQVGSVRALSCYFSWPSPPNITCTRRHTLHRTVCASMAASIVSSCINVQLCCLPLSLSSQSLSLLFVSLSPLKHVSLLQASFCMWSFQLSLLHSTGFLESSFQKERKAEKEGIQYTTPYEELGSKYASFVLKWLLSRRLSPVSVARVSLDELLHLTGQHRDGPKQEVNIRFLSFKVERQAKRLWLIFFSYVSYIWLSTWASRYQPPWSRRGRLRTNLFRPSATLWVSIPPPTPELGHRCEIQSWSTI